MKLLVYEYACGGGFAGKPFPADVLAEGFGMLRTFTADLKAAGHQVTVLLDGRIARFNPPLEAQWITVSSFKEAKQIISSKCQNVDASYIIAPETGGILQSLVQIVESKCAISLNCKSSAIQDASDKAQLYKVLIENGLPTPKTILFNAASSPKEIEKCVEGKLSYPLILKPLDGVSCGGLSLIKGPNHIEKALKKLKAESSSQRFIAQEYLQGEAASVSLICTDKKALAISLNKQDVTIGLSDENSSYNGGYVPFNHRLEDEAFSIAQKVVACFEGLRGYVGVDLVLGEDMIFVVDVNARLTTSYVGLSKITRFKVSESLIASILNSQFPSNTKSCGYAYFRKIQTPNISRNSFAKACEIDGVVSPPFPFSDKAGSIALIRGIGDGMEKAQIHLKEAKNNLLSVIDGEEQLG